ncbi:MAG: adenylosuccinate synthetase [archaeon]|nr:adenylosuccinate synthetase [Nanoarchaeota archaeon]
MIDDYVQEETRKLFTEGRYGEAQVKALIDLSEGDNCKSRFAGIISEHCDVTIRGTGGPNSAGESNGIVFRQIPASVEHDSDGHITIMGRGMAVNSGMLEDEVETLEHNGISCNNLLISEDAGVIMPYHRVADSGDMDMANGGIGTTGNGIGPCYADLTARIGIKVGDLYDEDVLRCRLEKAKAHYERVNVAVAAKRAVNAIKKLRVNDLLNPKSLRDTLREAMGPFNRVDIDRIIAEIKPSANRLRPYVTNTNREAQCLYREGKKILLTHGQGTGLSIDYGTYPWVTSSSATANGIAAGAGLCDSQVQERFGVQRWPYNGRVGGGPLPTEIGGKASEEWCEARLNDGSWANQVVDELEMFGIPYKIVDGKVKYDHHHPLIKELMNDRNELLVGISVRLAGGEYGGGSKRPRRIAWQNMQKIIYGAVVNNLTALLPSKLDVIEGMDRFMVYRDYDYDVNHSRGCDLYKVKPTDPIEFSGFYHSLNGTKTINDLPEGLRDSLEFLQWELFEKTGKWLDIPMASIGTGKYDLVVRG